MEHQQVIKHSLNCCTENIEDTRELSNILLIVCVANFKEVLGKNAIAESNPPFLRPVSIHDDGIGEFIDPHLLSGEDVEDLG
jgi:hypothetical protein